MCGIVGIISKSSEVASQLYTCLRALQHRGQESVGIATYDEGIKCIKGMGLVHEVFDNAKLASLKGNVGIAHVRYSTTGLSKPENAQPIVVSSFAGNLAITHNGDLVNANALREKLQKEGWAFITTTDSEIIVRLFANELAISKNDCIKAMKEVMKKIVGSYSLALLIKDKLIAVRDPLAIRPLCVGELLEGGYVIASESSALDAIDAKFVRDVCPGEIIKIDSNELKSYRVATEKYRAHCMFEYVYFARSDTVLDGKCVYNVRMDIGKRLAEEYPVNADLICPVPDSGTAYAIGYSAKSKITLVEGLVKNRYAWRTFILPYQQARDIGVKEKLNPVKSLIEGKKLVITDDSIVRGTTMGKIVRLLKKAGAKEVHVRIGSPPIIAPCFLGIDMKTRDQFIATKKSIPEIAKEIGADTLGYISIEGLVEAIAAGKENLCLGCLTGEYPIEISGEKLRFQQKLPIS
jgi:amidophosphoribosyltransferase